MGGFALPPIIILFAEPDLSLDIFNFRAEFDRLPIFDSAIYGDRLSIELLFNISSRSILSGSFVEDFQNTFSDIFKLNLILNY